MLLCVGNGTHVLVLVDVVDVDVGLLLLRGHVYIEVETLPLGGAGPFGGEVDMQLAFEQLLPGQ
jgi:hypothetical protein